MKNLDQYLKKFDKDVIKSKKAADKAANEKKIDESQKKDKFSETEKPPKKNRSEYVGFIKEAESSGILAFDYYNYKNIILLWVFIGVFFFSFGLFNSFIADKSFIIILFTVFVILYLITLLGYHTNYLLNLKSNELMKVYNLFSLQTDKLIADFREIKLIGVSTVFEVKNERVGATKNYEGDIVYFLEVVHETIAVIGYYNKTVVIGRTAPVRYNFNMIDMLKDISSSIDELNSKALAAAKIVGCYYVPGDGTSRIQIKEGFSDSDISTLIELIPKEKQLPEIDFDYKPDSKKNFHS